jgi:predicted AAA+ superfamily ATPase
MGRYDAGASGSAGPSDAWAAAGALVRDGQEKGNRTIPTCRTCIFAGDDGVIASAALVLTLFAMVDADLTPLLQRIADALERFAPTNDASNDLDAADAFVWHAEREWCEPVANVNRVPLALLRGIDRVRDILLENTERFAAGLPANNVLLWGARGTGKSALIKAAHAAVNEARPHALALIEIHREDIPTLPRLLALVRDSARRCLLFCDDLSFDNNDASYKSLKAVLEGGIEGRPGNVVLYATSNRRHLMPRDMIENERSTAINPAEAVEEKVSLSDRFGLWLGFHNVDQDTYQAIVRGYAKHYGLDLPLEQLHADANEWSITRGARSGRVAWQFIQDLAGRLGKPLS